MVTKLSLTAQAQQVLAERLQAGDVAIDATVGNGHDTLFLATRVGSAGKVYGFDIQQQALDGAWQRLEAAGQETQCSLYHAGHEVMGALLPQNLQGRVRAVMFNLGYLPGADRQRTTAAATTLTALQTALPLLMSGGVISLIAYTGHPGGREEAEQVKAWASTLSAESFRLTLQVPVAERSSPPEWLLLERL